MTTIRIPNHLKVTTTAFSASAPGGVWRTDVAGGSPRYGLEWDRGTQQFRVQMVLDAMQLGIWSVFFLRVIRKGAITFAMPIDSGMGLQDHDCHIVPETYATSRVGGQYTTVSFAVEATPSAFAVSDADAAALLGLWDVAGETSGDLLERIARFALVDSLSLDF